MHAAIDFRTDEFHSFVRRVFSRSCEFISLQQQLPFSIYFVKYEFNLNDKHFSPLQKIHFQKEKKKVNDICIVYLIRFAFICKTLCNDLDDFRAFF